MSKFNIDNYACNGVRIAQYSKFILLGFMIVLCLSIVTLGVFSNLNALATDNIAFADEEERNEEPVRIVSSTGYYDNNLFPNSWGAFWDYNLSINNTNSFELIESFNNGAVNFSWIGTGTLVNNVLTCTSEILQFRINFVDITGFNGNSSYHVCAIGYHSSDTFNFSFNYKLNSNASVSNSISSNSIYSSYSSSGNMVNGNLMGVILSPGQSLTLDWFYLANTRTFNGYVSPNYTGLGYNQGYDDGLADASGSGSTGFPVDTGYVGTNILPNSYCAEYDYDISLNESSERFYSNDSWIYNISADGTATFSNNIITNGTSNSILIELESSLVSGDYVFTLGFTSLDTFDVKVSVYNPNTYDSYSELAEKNNNNAPYWLYCPFTIPSANQRSTGTPIIINILIDLDSSDSISLNFFKLETGEYFTGYERNEDGNYQEGYVEGYDVGYDEGYDTGYYNGVLDFNFKIFEKVQLGLNGGLGANFDQPEMATNIYELSTGLVRIFSEDGEAHTYSTPVNCAFYFDFTGTLVPGSVILINYNFSVSFNGLQRIYYRFAPIHSTYTSDEVFDFYDGYFDNNSTDVMLNVPLETSRIYFCVRVNETIGIQGAGGLPYYYLYSYSLNTGDTVYCSTLPIDSNAVRDAYDKGYIDGKGDGIIIGQNEQPYSFRGLFSAIYGVPINAFNNLFNFDVFGVNMRTFIIGMITFALALFVWKIIVRGG